MKNIRRGLGIVLLLIIAVLAVTPAALKHLYPVKYSEEISRYSELYGVDEYLLYALIETESGFDPDAVSDAGAIGLTQITEETFDWLKLKMGGTESFEQLFEPEISVKYSAFFLKLLTEEFGERQTVAAAYHAGRGRVNEWLADPDVSADGRTLAFIPSSDTAHYVNKIEKNYKIYIDLYNRKDGIS